MKAIISIFLMFGLQACSLGKPIEKPVDSARAVENISVIEKPAIVSRSAIHPRANGKLRGDDSDATLAYRVPLESWFSHVAHVGKISSLVVTPDGKGAFSGGTDGKVVFSSLNEDAKGKIAFKTHTVLVGAKPILALSLSPDGESLAIAQYSTVTIVDLRLRKITNQLTQIKGRITAVQWDPRGELLAIGGTDGGLFVWNLSVGRYAGRDSIKAVESYPVARSPIVSIVFHPSGRTFFAAERNGVVDLWKLIRTEYAMGLRDERAEADSREVGRELKRVNLLEAARNFAPIVQDVRPKSFRIEDMWLGRKGYYLFVATSDGGLYKIKVRGLRVQERVHVSSDLVSSLAGIDLMIGEDNSSNTLSDDMTLLATTGREAKLRFLCVTQGESQLIAETDLFAESLALVRVGGLGVRKALEASSTLWVTQKTGNLLTFNTSLLFQAPGWRHGTNPCSDLIR